MKIGIIGKPQAGKSVLFRLLTKHGAAASGKAQLAVGRIPDPRVDALAELYKPRKVTYATIDFWDVPGFQPGRSSLDFLQSVRDVDALVAVLRAFESDLVPSITGIQPYTDFKDLQQELLIADWTSWKPGWSAWRSSGAKPQGRGRAGRAGEVPGNPGAGSAPAQPKAECRRGEACAELRFLHQKPLIAAVNLDEGQMAAGSYPQEEELEAELARMDVP